MKDVIYINGNKHYCEWAGDRMYADMPELPQRRCSQHTFNTGARAHLENGGTVLANGNRYSMRPPTMTGMILHPTVPVEDAVDDVYDSITQWIAYGIGVVMALVMFCGLLGYIWTKFGQYVFG